MSAEKWKEALRRTPDCIPIERLGEELTPREHSHLAHCATCQAELALWQHVDDDEQTPAERAAVERVADDVRRRLQTPANVVPMRRRRFQPAALAAAAAVVLAIAIGIFIENREPSIGGPATEIRTYRSAAVDVLEPRGDVAAPPAALVWKPVAGATRYDVDVTEVDHTILWHTTTTATSSALPQPLVAQFVPGKTILWQVRARHDQAIVADSGVQRFRVATAK